MFYFFTLLIGLIFTLLLSSLYLIFKALEFFPICEELTFIILLLPKDLSRRSLFNLIGFKGCFFIKVDLKLLLLELILIFLLLLFTLIFFFSIGIFILLLPASIWILDFLIGLFFKIDDKSSFLSFILLLLTILFLLSSFLLLSFSSISSSSTSFSSSLL